MRKLFAILGILFLVSGVALAQGRGRGRMTPPANTADFSILCGAGGPQVQLCTYPSAPLVTIKRWMQMGGVIEPGPYVTTITAIVGADTTQKQVSCTKTKCSPK